MTQYILNPNFSADPPWTLADCNNTLGITGFTQLLPQGASCQLRPYVLWPVGSPVGSNVVRLTDMGYGQTDGVLSQTGPGNIAANTDTEILFLFRVQYVQHDADYGRIRDTGTTSAQQWYALCHPNPPNGNVRLAFFKSGGQWQSVPASSPDVQKNFAANTWYWARIRVATSSGTWSWKLWTPPFSSEPTSWDSTGNNDVEQTSGYVGVGTNATDNLPIEYAWFTSAINGDSAPGPPPVYTPIAPYPKKRRRPGGLTMGLVLSEWW